MKNCDVMVECCRVIINELSKHGTNDGQIEANKKLVQLADESAARCRATGCEDPRHQFPLFDVACKMLVGLLVNTASDANDNDEEAVVNFLNTIQAIINRKMGSFSKSAATPAQPITSPLDEEPAIDENGRTRAFKKFGHDA